MLEGMVPYFKRALIVAVVLYAFFAIAQLALAQGLPNNPGPDT